MNGALLLWPHMGSHLHPNSSSTRSCGRQSESSAASFDFYELQLQVQGFTSLVDSLVRQYSQGMRKEKLICMRDSSDLI